MEWPRDDLIQFWANSEKPRDAAMLISLSALPANGWTDLHEIFREDVEWPWDDLITHLAHSEKPCDATMRNTRVGFVVLLHHSLFGLWSVFVSNRHRLRRYGHVECKPDTHWSNDYRDWGNYSVSQTHVKFSDILPPKWLGIFGPNLTCLLYVPIYVQLKFFLLNYRQLRQSYATLSSTI